MELKQIEKTNYVEKYSIRDAFELLEEILSDNSFEDEVNTKESSRELVSNTIDGNIEFEQTQILTHKLIDDIITTTTEVVDLNIAFSNNDNNVMKTSNDENPPVANKFELTDVINAIGTITDFEKKAKSTLTDFSEQAKNFSQQPRSICVR